MIKRSELTARIGNKFPQLPEEDVRMVVQCILDGISNALAKGRRVEVRGFGALTVRTRAPRLAHNPKSGQAVAVPGKRKIHFKPSHSLTGNLLKGEQLRINSSDPFP
jgi:integration host factor subunit beta